MVISSWVTALRAPKTLNRCRPDGAFKNKRVTLQRYPRKGAKTK
ncbi:hypothetical protein MNBD_UNCLBAC01-859 [hydrothermal vent metagenome]|uniref:Uncharacterized protein n=1 Tax=hydrothermal vent metagenome TaxID=652676 RepID=A0A3B1DPB7_9ZZZZ